MKRCYLLLVILFAIVGAGWGQSRLSDSRQGSENRLIYTVSQAELRNVYLKEKPWTEKIMGHKVGEYPINGKMPQLERGNYLLVEAKHHQLEITPRVVDDLNFQIVPASDFMLVLYDSLGQPIVDARVKHGSRTIAFDPLLQAYRCSKIKVGETVEVNNRGVLHYIRIQTPRPYYTPGYTPENGKGSSLASFFCNLPKIVKKWFRPSEKIENFEGFVVFSKPRYKPGETVRLKGYVAYSDGTPYDRPVGLRLTGGYRPRLDTLITTLASYRPGMYQYDFALTDSLGMQLDNSYWVRLEDLQTKRALSTNLFRYEDYELRGLRFTLHPDKKHYTGRDSIRLGFDVRDENGVEVNDGRIVVTVVPDRYNQKLEQQPDFYFIPDTLWQQTIYLDTLASKQFILPEKAFPQGISLRFRVNCRYLTPDNESYQQIEVLQKDASSYLITAAFEKGRLQLAQYYCHRSEAVQATVIFSDANHIVRQSSLALPGEIVIPWNATQVRVATPNRTETFMVRDLLPYDAAPLDYSFFRRNDSVQLLVMNRAEIPFWYSVRRKNKEVAQGYGRELSYRMADLKREGFSMRLSYLFGGRSWTIERDLPYQEANLRMTVETPLTVSPGQTVPVTVSLQSREGLPVADADVTAYAYTSKFKQNQLPNLAIPGVFRQAKPINTTRYQGDVQHGFSDGVAMTWDKWRDVMMLDTIEYYHFLYPDHHYAIAEKNAGNQTLVAPFVVDNGEVIGVEFLWIDGILHYLKGAEQKNPYVFAVSPGWHSFRFRTQNYEMAVDSVNVCEGKKNIYSFNATAGIKGGYQGRLPQIRTHRLPRSRQLFFSKEELRLLTKNLILVNDNAGTLSLPGRGAQFQLPQWIAGGNRLYYLKEGGAKHNWHGLLVGPFPQRFILNDQTDLLRMYERDSLLATFPFRGGADYTIYPEYMSARAWSNGLSELPALTDGLFLWNFKELPTSRQAIQADFRNRQLDAMARSAGMIYEHPDSKSPKNEGVKLQINLRGVSNTKTEPVLIWMEQQDGNGVVNNGLSALYYGMTRALDFGQDGMVRVTLLYRDSTYYSHTLSLRKGGLNVWNVDSVMSKPADEWSAGIFGLFDSLVKENRILNPYRDAKDNLQIHSAPVSEIAWDKRTQKGTELFMVDDALFEEEVTNELFTVSENRVMASGLQPRAAASKAAGVIENMKDIPVEEEEIQKEVVVDIAPVIAPAEGGIRHNFRDDAFWQPRLQSDSTGKVRFEITYPDDITSWDAFFVAIGDKKQRSKQGLQIRSLLTRSARLSVPRFAIVGDSLTAVGRIINDGGDTVWVERSIRTNGRIDSAHIQVMKTYLDKIPVKVVNEDSLQITYAIRTPDGVTDGEERKIPVLPQGMWQAKGDFRVINDAKSYKLKLENASSQAVFHAETTPMNIFLQEIERVENYPYDCNEQMASKIKVLLARKAIYAQLKKPFNEDKKIRSLVKKLAENQNSEGLWGWWNKDGSELWISQQVIEALLQAEKANYRAKWNKQLPVRSLEQQLTAMLELQPGQVLKQYPDAKERLLNQLLCLKLLDARIDYTYYLTKIEVGYPNKQLTDAIKGMRLKQLVGTLTPEDIRELENKGSKTLLGSLYWEDKSDKPMPIPRFAMPDHNRNITTLTAYAILREAGNQDALLEQVRNYFFECRRTGAWQNTYESARILETILPDMRVSSDTLGMELRVNGEQITRFPYTARTGSEVEVSKTGASPVFVSLYEEQWLADPAAESEKGFKVMTRFVTNDSTRIATLTTGQPVLLEVTVTCNQTASYVAIEVPIPAGCSYNNKQNHWFGNDSHREYFKEKTLICVPELTPGTHTFRIELMPRYSGSYTLNPAKASLMYFPVFAGNNRVGRIEIAE